MHHCQVKRWNNSIADRHLLQGVRLSHCMDGGRLIVEQWELRRFDRTSQARSMAPG
jgi:hypothetical protein